MKKVALLALLLVLCCTQAMAEIDISVVDRTTGENYRIAGDEVNYRSYVVGEGAIHVSCAPSDMLISLGVQERGVSIYRLDPMSQERIGAPIYYTAVTEVTTGGTWGAVVPQILDDTLDGSEVAYEVVVSWSYVNDAGETQVIEETEVFYVNAVDMNKTVVSGTAWYPDNHAHTFGPTLVDDWRTYSIVDLTKDGTTKLRLIAAGAWDLGTVDVTVTGDEMRVTYLMHEDVKTTDIHNDVDVKGDYLNLYTDRTAIDTNLPSRFDFDQPISIEKDLHGARTVAIYAEIVVDYPSHSPYVYRFWPNMPANKAIVTAMEALMPLE